MYVFISALKWHCQARDIWVSTQQCLVLLLRVKLHYHRVPLEGDRKRGTVTEKTNYYRHTPNKRCPSPDHLKTKGEMKIEGWFTKRILQTVVWWLQDSTDVLQAGQDTRVHPDPTHQAVLRAKPGIQGGGNIGTSALRLQRASPARSPQNCHQSPQPEPGLPSASSRGVGRVSSPFFF